MIISRLKSGKFEMRWESFNEFYWHTAKREKKFFKFSQSFLMIYFRIFQFNAQTKHKTTTSSAILFLFPITVFTKPDPGH